MPTRKQVQDKKKVPTKVMSKKTIVKKPKVESKYKKMEPYEGKVFKKITKKK